jgi:hypothetical protein
MDIDVEEFGSWTRILYVHTQERLRLISHINLELFNSSVTAFIIDGTSSIAP